jgi:hypothetical protein
MNKSPLILGVIAVGNLAVGAVVGYKVAEKRLSVRFDRRLETETADMREFYTVHPHQKKYPNPAAAVADLIQPSIVEGDVEPPEKVAYHKIVKSGEYTSEDDPEEELAIEAEVGKEVSRNVFEEKADPEQPYIISQEDYMQGEPDFQQATLTYYELDKILTDEREDRIDDINTTVGEQNIQFGVGSSDENVVHVRNVRLRMDFEIIRSEGAYAKEVLGLDEMDPPRKMSRRQQRGE